MRIEQFKSIFRLPTCCGVLSFRFRSSHVVTPGPCNDSNESEPASKLREILFVTAHWATLLAHQFSAVLNSSAAFPCNNPQRNVKDPCKLRHMRDVGSIRSVIPLDFIPSKLWRYKGPMPRLPGRLFGMILIPVEVAGWKTSKGTLLGPSRTSGGLGRNTKIFKRTMLRLRRLQIST